MLCQQHWWLVPSIFSHYFPFWGSPPQKSLVDLPLWGGLKGWLSMLLFPKLLNTTFQAHFFGSFTFVFFSKWADSFLIKLKDPQPPSFMVHLLTLPKVLDFFSWSAGSQAICLFLHHWVTDGTHPFLFFMLMGMLSWAVSIPIAVLLHTPKIPGFWEFLGVLVQLSTWVP